MKQSGKGEGELNLDTGEEVEPLEFTEYLLSFFPKTRKEC